MDDCDFSGSNASVLVYSEPSSKAVIRNTVLGDINCELQWFRKTNAATVAAFLFS